MKYLQDASAYKIWNGIDMISGIFYRTLNAGVKQNEFETFVQKEFGFSNKRDVHVHTNGSVGFFSYPPYDNQEYNRLYPVSTPDKKLSVVFSGIVYNESEIIKAQGLETGLSASKNASETILILYRKCGIDFIKKLNGKFAFALYDKYNGKIYLVRDRVGIEPLYYYLDRDKLVFSSNIQSVFRYPNIVKTLNIRAIEKFLLFNYNPGFEIFFKEIYRHKPAHFLSVDNRHENYHRYWQLRFDPMSNPVEKDITSALLEHLRRSVKIRISPDRNPGIFLSGGMDSSTILGLCATFSIKPIDTFSYRCRSKSFDESYYARYMAKSANATHREEDYSENDILLMPKIVASMNEPFCDVGINIATHILGKYASQKTNYVFTGDGGDELFGGHPVYEADKIARYFDKIPCICKSFFSHLFSLLPDSDKKKTLMVKLKRFSESVNLPAELITHRWRVYYSFQELNLLMSNSDTDRFHQNDLLNDILNINQESEGLDILSRAIYSDYQTAVDFYLRRNDLNQQYFNLETRYPMLDHQLIEFCATIPSTLKIEGWFNTKYIFKKTMEGVLPHDIIYRKDKLGHSIPLKNWMRQSSIVKEFIFDFLSENTIRNRGIFNPSFISELFEDHLSKKRNNSHRLWALAVLEMWLRHHYDA